MSVRADVEAALNLIKQEARAALSEASALAQDAAAILTGEKPAADFDLKVELTPSQPPNPFEIQPPPSLIVKPYVRPELGRLTPIIPAELNFAEPVPTLDLPSFHYEPLRWENAETVQPPGLPTGPALPTAPTTRLREGDALVPPVRQPLAGVGGAPPPVAEPQIATLAVDFRGAFAQGLAWARTVIPDRGPAAAITDLDSLLIRAVQQRLRGEVTAAASDAGEDLRRYAQQRMAQATESAKAAAGLDAQTQADAWMLPGADRMAGELALERAGAQAAVAAAIEIRRQRAGKEQDLAQQTLTLAQTLLTTAVDLQLKEAERILHGYEIALHCGETALELATQVLTVKQQEVALYEKYNALQGRRLDALITVRKNAADVARAEAEQTRVEAQYNTMALNRHQVQLADVRRLVKLKATQQEARRLELDGKILPVRLYAIKIQQFEAQIKQHRLEWEAFSAQLHGEAAKVEGLTAQARLYDAQIQQFTAQAQAAAATIRAQTAANAQNLARADAELNAVEEEFRLQVAVADTAVEALRAGGQAAVAEGEAQSEQQRLDLEKEIETARAELQRMRSDLTYRLKGQALDLSRRKTQGQIRVGSARVYGALAESALTALNSLAVSEETASS